MAGNSTVHRRPAPGAIVAAEPGAHDIVAVPLRHPGRWVLASLILLALLGVGTSLWQNPNIDHPTIAKYLFSDRIVAGAVLTVALTIITMVLSTILGIVLALMRLSANPVLNSVAWLYVWIFRGTPLLVQIVFWGYLGLLYKQLSLGVPFTDFTVFTVDTNALIPAFVAGVIALTTNQAAYTAEIVRAGMLSVDQGQKEACYSLGMTPLFTLFKVELPQAMRVIIPPMGNETISMLKDTALLSLIAVAELYTVAARISSQNLHQVELLIVVSIWYLALTSILSVPQYYLERHYGRGSRTLGPTPIGRAVALAHRVRRSQEGIRS